MPPSESSQSCPWPPVMEVYRRLQLLCQQGDGEAGNAIDDNFRVLDDLLYQWFGSPDNVVWDDLRVPVTATTVGTARQPAFGQWLTNGAGSTGVYTYFFPDGNATNERDLFFGVQLPHGYKYGTDLKPHIHWSPKTTGLAGQKVSWGMEYTLAKIGSTFPNTTIISANTHYLEQDPIVANNHYLTPLPDIDGSGIDSVSAMLFGRVWRDCGGVLQADGFTGDVGLLEIDFHYQIDAVGSDDLYTKTE